MSVRVPVSNQMFPNLGAEDCDCSPQDSPWCLLDHQEQGLSTVTWRRDHQGLRLLTDGGKGSSFARNLNQPSSSTVTNVSH